jgi:hypothetical protein
MRPEANSSLALAKISHGQVALGDPAGFLVHADPLQARLEARDLVPGDGGEAADPEAVRNVDVVLPLVELVLLASTGLVKTSMRSVLISARSALSSVRCGASIAT